MMSFKVSKECGLLCLLLICIGLACIWFFNSFTMASKQVDLGYSHEARQDEFLAAKQLMAQFGYKVQSKTDFSLFESELDHKDSVFIASSRVGMSTAQRKAMRRWVENGGRLILLATEPYAAEKRQTKDTFLDSLGVRLYQDTSTTNTTDEEEIVKYITNADMEGPLELHFNSHSYLVDSQHLADKISSNAFSDLVIEYSLGYGKVVVLSEFSIWNNSKITAHDHALFLLRMLQPCGDVYVVHKREQASLLNLLWQHATIFVISFVIVLVLVIVSLVWREGRPKANTHSVQREITLHLRAAGEFIYRLNAGNLLLKKMRENLENKLAQRLIGFSQFDEKTKIIKLAELTGIEHKKIEKVWNCSDNSQDSFISTVRIIQSIRKHL
ncbi:DUF4350 domain-containing protein [Aliikangiella sp. IMCC44653]